MASLRCYHHCNCDDHPAVVTCSKCGKGLCRECADNLRSEDTGKILCVDCLNEEVLDEAAWGFMIKRSLKKELITMIVGFIIGIIALIVLFAINEGLFFIAFIFCFPTLLASLGTIVKLTFNCHWLFWLPVFLILCVVSPIMFIVRVVKHVKRMKLAKDYAHWQVRKKIANDEYARCAKEMTTLVSDDEFERDLSIKYAQLIQQNQAEAERLIADERAQRLVAEQHNAELAAELAQKGAEIKDSEDKMKELQAREAKTNIANRRARAAGRTTDEVDSGKKAA